MTRRRRPRLQRDVRGAATVEFALWTALFFGVVLAALDFAMYHMQSGKIDEAVSASAVQAFQQGSSASFATIPGYVRDLAGDSGLTVTTSCNGIAGACTNVARTCACLNGSGAYVVAACGASCSGSGMTTGSTAGYYLTVTATRAFRAVVVPRGLLNNAQITRAATVRLQ